MKIKELIFEKFSGTFSYFILGKIEGYKNIRYYIYIFENKFEVIDWNEEKHYFVTVEEAKEFCQKDFNEKIKNSIYEN